MRKTMLMTVAALAAAELFAIQGTVSTAVESVSGDVKWHARDKKYIIEKGKITKEFKLADVTSLDIPKPAGFDKAVQAVENGQGASAVATLTKIVADYRMLQWDKPAGRYLTLAHLAAGNAQKAEEDRLPKGGRGQQGGKPRRHLHRRSQQQGGANGHGRRLPHRHRQRGG